MKTCSFKNIVVIIIIIIIIFFCKQLPEDHQMVFSDLYWLLLYPCKNSSTQFYSTKSRTKRSNKGVHQSRSAVYTRSNCNSSPILAWDGAWNYASAVKDKTNQLFTGMKTTYNFLDLQTEILPCLSFGPTNHIYMYCPHVDWMVQLQSSWISTRSYVWFLRWQMLADKLLSSFLIH